jgi:hypothetical protein
MGRANFVPELAKQDQGFRGSSQVEKRHAGSVFVTCLAADLQALLQ